MLKDNSSLVDLSGIKDKVRSGVTTVKLLSHVVASNGSLETVRAVSLQDLNYEHPNDIFTDFGLFKGLIMLNLRGLRCNT